MSQLDPSLLAFLGGAASIDWCEPNYIVSPHVAEFANTWTSIFMCIVAAYAFYWKRKQRREKRYLLLEVFVIVIGLGSALFHGTLSFYGQLADELPMLWGAFVWAFVVYHTERRKTDWLFVGFLALLALAWTSVSKFIHFEHNWIFELFFGLIIFFAMVLLVVMIRRSKSVWANRLLFLYILFAVTAFLLWNLDQIYCKQLTPLYLAHPHWTSLHSWWHTLMSFNMYFGSMLGLLLRQEYLYPSDVIRVSFRHEDNSFALLPILQPPKIKK